MYKTVFFFVLGVAVFSQASASCFGPCGLGSGEDVCSNNNPNRRCQPLVVRPQAVPKPPQATIAVPAPPLRVPLPAIPLGGPCFCKKPVVKPAVIPKPVCNPCNQVYQRRVSSSSNCALNQQNNQEIVETLGGFQGGAGCGGAGFGAAGFGAGIGGAGYGAPYPLPLPETREQLAPADAVSVAIAYNLAKKQQNLKEDILSFGFRQLPKEVPAQQMRKTNNIPEENLYSLNGAIVELKPVATIGKSLDEEAAEQLLDLQEEETVGEAGVRKLSLGEIGYGLAKIAPTATYVDVPPIPMELTAPVCKDPNYVPGQVTFNTIPKLENVVLPVPLPEPCPESNCKYTDLGEFGTYKNYGCNSCGYRSSSSSSSKCSQSNNVFVQKLGCGCL